MTTAGPITADQFAGMPDTEHCELVQGRVVRVGPPKPRHGVTTAKRAAAILPFVTEHDLGVVTAADAGHVLARDPDTVRGPDVGFIAKARIPAEGPPEDYWEGAPDLAVEVVSPGDRWSQVEAKADDWLRAGAGEVWLVDTEARRIKVLWPDQAPQSFGGTEVLRSRVLPGFELRAEQAF